MAVALVTQFQVNPGRNLDFMALVSEAKKIHERVGAKVRVWTATIAGPNTGNVSYVIEHADMSAYAAFSDKLQADKDWQAFVVKAFNANPTSRVLGSTLATEAAV